MSTPARSRWTAVVCRTVCGLTRFAAKLGMESEATFPYEATSRCIPNRVIGLPVRPRNTRSSRPVSAINGRNAATVSVQSGQTRHLLPLPSIRTEAEVPSCSSPTVSWAASSARAPVLYRNKSSAWSRAPRRVRRSGIRNSASSSAFSRYPMTVLAVFLKGMERISMHHANCSGARLPMKRAREWIVPRR